MTAVKALRNALGNALPRAQENRLGRILKQKDEAQYGARRGRLARALELLVELREYAQWAESAMRDR